MPIAAAKVEKSRNQHQMLMQRAILSSAHINRSQSMTASTSTSPRWGGRLPGARTRERGFSLWPSDYLGENPVYSLRQFRQRFRVPRALFFRLRDDLVAHNPRVWSQRKDCFGKWGQPTDVKVLLCLRYIGTGRSFDDLDDSSRMARETARQYVNQFYIDVNEIYGAEFYNRYPNRAELKEIAERYEDAGFPGCIGAVDCTDLIWKNCPLQEKGQYHNPKDSKLAVIKIEAWCDMDLYIWHWFPGRPGTTNDKTMVSFSPLFIEIFNRTYELHLPTPYRLNANSVERSIAYFLGDGIYPRYPIFVLPIHETEEEGKKRYSKRQEGRRKDIERAFGVIKARFRILRNEDFRWYKGDILICSRTCVILHNILVRMNQEGHFVEDLAAEADDFNIITEMFEYEQRSAATRYLERENRAVHVQNEIAEIAPGSLLEEMFLREVELTCEAAHHAMQEELIARFAAEHAASV